MNTSKLDFNQTQLDSKQLHQQVERHSLEIESILKNYK